MKRVLAFILHASIKTWSVIKRIAVVALGAIPHLLCSKLITEFLRFYLLIKQKQFHSSVTGTIQKRSLRFIRSHYSPIGYFFISLRGFGLILCVTTLLVSADYLLTRLFSNDWKQYITSGKFYITRIVSTAWITKILNTLDYSALGNVAMSIGVTGALFSWLLQIIKEEECGIEMGFLFKRFFPGYVINLWAFIASAAICIYCCAIASNIGNSRLELRFIILCNLISMVFELLYMALMCRKFLFNFQARKDSAHAVLFAEIKNAWSSGQGNWYSPELNNLFGDFSYIVTNQKRHKWTLFTKRFATPNYLLDVIVNWVTHISRLPYGKADSPIEEDTFRACDEMIGLLQKKVVGEMTSYLHGCFMIVEYCIRRENEKAEKAEQKTLHRKNRLHNWANSQFNYFSKQNVSIPKWFLDSANETERDLSSISADWDAYFQETKKHYLRRENIAGIIDSLYLNRYIKTHCANATNESILNFCDEANIAISFLKTQDCYRSDVPTRFALRFASLLICLNKDKSMKLGNMLISIKQRGWCPFLENTSSVAEECFSQSRGTLNMFEHTPYYATTTHQTAEAIYRHVFIA